MRWVFLAIFLVFAAALFTVMARTWRTRTRKQSELVPRVPVPTTMSAATGSWDGFVVATTHADAPLERVTAGGLGFRARGGFETHAEGLVLVVAGEPDRFIDLGSIRGADRAQVAIDRVVEPGGLVRLRWTATGAAGATDLDTYFRFPTGDDEALVALRELIGAGHGATNTTPHDAAGEGEQH
jgi:hypothetical protein